MASKLYVGGLSYSTTGETLREYFAQCGTVESASVITDKFSGQSRGFGFIEMSTAEEAQRAISELNGKELDGRKITVNVSNPRAPGSGGGAAGPVVRVAAAVAVRAAAVAVAGSAAATAAPTAFPRRRSRSAGRSTRRGPLDGPLRLPPPSTDCAGEAGARSGVGDGPTARSPRPITLPVSTCLPSTARCP